MGLQTLKLFWQTTWRYKWLLIWSEVGATLFILSNNIAGPYVISLVIDKLTKADVSQLTIDNFIPLLILFALIRFAYFISGRIMMLTYIKLEPRGVSDLEVLSFKNSKATAKHFLPIILAVRWLPK